ncbi:MAG: DNA repair protein RecN [Alphaproteobacteria bacterium]
MLNSLTINNIVIISQARIEFKSGLCVLTGETGSGKSILLDALGLAIGFRSTSRLIGSNSNKAEVSAEFDIANNNFCKKILVENSLIDDENPDNLRIRRIILENSTSKVFVNDQTIGVNLLSKIGETLVEINGQHDQHGLLNSSLHLTMLDEFANNSQLLAKLRKKYQELKNIDQEISEINHKTTQANREQDYLEHVIKELSEADVKENEEQQLIANKEKFLAQEKILNFLNDLKQNLSEALGFLMSSQRIFLKNQNIIDNHLIEQIQQFKKFSEDSENNLNNIEQFITFINNIIRSINGQNFDRDTIEERLFIIKNLARKFNVQSNELSKIIEDAYGKINLISDSKKILNDLQNQKSEHLKQYHQIAEELSNKRQKSAKILSKKVEEELQFLKMAETKFKVEFVNLEKNTNSEKIAEEYNFNGLDRVKFLASTNNNNFDEITKIASGGELSRFMLALKVALIDVKSTPTIIFDEIDTGISGSTAQAVGKRLKTLASNLQILVVTHQAQIASKADTHFKISKKLCTNSVQKKYNTIIEILNNSQSDQEIARMLSGEEISDEAMLVAKNLRNS